MVSTRNERITAPDGGVFDADVALPESGKGQGILVIQEIFGVNAYIQERCADLARMGYVAVAPDAFWRLEPNIVLDHSPEGLERAFGYMRRYDSEQGLRDLTAALEHLRRMPEVTGKVGVLGFCFGGTASYMLACHANPDAAVSYYGARIGTMLDQGEGITCPLLFQYGAKDQYIPPDEIAAVGAFAASKLNIEQHVYDAGHAFDNHLNPMFGEPKARDEAWNVTAAFLARHLPVQQP